MIFRDGYKEVATLSKLSTTSVGAACSKSRNICNSGFESRSLEEYAQPTSRNGRCDDNP